MHANYSNMLLQAIVHSWANMNPSSCILAMILREIVWRRVKNFVTFLHTGADHHMILFLFRDDGDDDDDDENRSYTSW